MPIIKRRPKEALKSVLVRLPESLAAKLTAYAEFSNVPQNEIVATAVAYAISSDKEFEEVSSRIASNSDSRSASRKVSAKHMSMPVAAGNDAAHP